MIYVPVIGLEVHVQTKTKSKMFCSCDANYFGDEPNTHTCPVCLGLPGAMPVPNKKAIEYCVMVSLALGCNINMHTHFDRKNYFYPDLPKGFQISQYDRPIGYDGLLKVEVGDGFHDIRIRRVHQEEDTGKSIHENGMTLLDYNKSGMPLVEIVTEPDFTSVEEVANFARRLRQIVRYLDVSNADMERGEMRFELNISLRDENTTELPSYKVEVKNIGSISVLEKVILGEIQRHSEILERGETPVQETRGLVDMSGKTVSQRVKESESDYRYFPEPDIPPIEFEESYIEEIKRRIPELPDQKKARYIADYKIMPEKAEVIVDDIERTKEFESAIDGRDEKLVNDIANIFIGDYLSIANTNVLKSDKFMVSYIADIAELKSAGKITGVMAKEILSEVYESGEDPKKLVKDRGLEVVSDAGELDKVVKQVISDNPKVVEDTKKNPNAMMFLVGQVMKQMKGQADAKVVRELMEKNLSA